MRYKILAAALVSVLVFSGCVGPTNQTPEAKAVALADNTPEIRLVQKMVDGIANIEKCSTDEYISMAQTMAAGQGSPAPEVTPEMRGQAEQMLNEAKEWSQKCQLSLEKTAEQVEESKYLVSYTLETSDDPECSIPSDPIGVNVDLEAGTAEVEGSVAGAQEQMAMVETMLLTMGDCAGLLYYSAFSIS